MEFVKPVVPIRKLIIDLAYSNVRRSLHISKLYQYVVD